MPGSPRFSGGMAFGGDARADAFPGNHAGDIADFLIIEHDNVDVVFHAVMHRLRIHDLEIPCEHLAE